MKRVIYNVFWMAMIITVAMAGCKKNDGDDGKGDGILKINENEYPITEANMFVGTITNFSSFLGRYIFFSNKKKKVTIQVTMDTSLAFSSGTYPIMFLGLTINDELNLNTDNAVMVVNKSDNIYDITITGKTNVKEFEYKITYKGTIREGKL